MDDMIKKIVSSGVIKEMPLESAVVKALGKGVVIDRLGVRERVFYNRKRRLWVSFSINLEDKVYLPVFEILFSAVPLVSDKFEINVEFSQSTYGGLEIGDSLDAVYSKLGLPFKKNNDRDGLLAGLGVFEYFPSEFKAYNGRFQVFMKSGKVVAFSVATVD